MKFLIPLLVISSCVFSLSAQQKIQLDISADCPFIGSLLELNDSNGHFISSVWILDKKTEISTTYSGPASLHFYQEDYNDTSIYISVIEGLTRIDNFCNPSKSYALKEIQIKKRKPAFEKTIDGIKIQIQESFLGKSIHGQELLSRIPGVTITGNQVQLLGRGQVMIMMQGHEVSLETFKSTPVKDIKSIEIIENPGVKYDSRAKAILLVELKKSIQEGYEISLSESISNSFVKSSNWLDYPMQVLNVQTNYRKGPWFLTGYYANEAGRNWSDNQFSIDIQTPQGKYLTQGYYRENARLTSVHSYRFGLGFHPSRNHQFSLQYDGLSHLFNLDVRQDAQYQNPQAEITQIKMLNDASTRLNNHTFNLNHFYQSDSQQKQLFTALQYNRFINLLSDNIEETITPYQQPLNINFRQNRGRNLIELLTFQTDLNIKKGNWQHELGSKWYYISNSGRLNFFSRGIGDEQFIQDAFRSNGNIYQEKVPAIYASTKWNKHRWFLQAGMRLEWSLVQAYSRKTETQIIDTNYLNIFPQLTIRVKLNQHWNSGLSYVSKITRPDYQDLDPFLWYLDSLSSIQGNPSLRPEYTHQFEWKTAFRQYQLKLSYNYTQNVIWAITQEGQSGINSTVFIKDNLRKRNWWQLSMDIPYEYKNYQNMHKIALNYWQLYHDNPGFLRIPARPQFYLYSYHQYRIPKWFHVEFIGEYYGASSDGLNNRQATYFISAGISKNFFSDRLQCQLFMNDLLRTARWQGIRTLGIYQNPYSRRSNTQFIRLSLSYTLSKLQSFEYKNKTVNDQEFNRIRK